jgi:sulfur-oxidizing protein SoxY
MKTDTIGRRSFLDLAGSTAAGGLVVLTLAPLAAEATPQSVQDAIEKALGKKPLKTGKIALTLPEIAEDGNVVSLGVAVESPMTAEDHVKEVRLYADGNPLPDIANYRFGPQNGKVDFSLRIRLAKTQNIVAVATMSNGDSYIARRKIKVTIGGCGG